MKVTKSYIKQLVKEELKLVLELKYEMGAADRSNPVTWEELESNIKSKVPEAEFGNEYTIKVGGQLAFSFPDESSSINQTGTYLPKMVSPKLRAAQEQVYNILSVMHQSRGIEIMPGRFIKTLKPVQSAYGKGKMRKPLSGDLYS
tara:strand:- start:128 stop:562 length:435 start_codon:yes stop_codon:yes gene_type:complete